MSSNEWFTVEELTGAVKATPAYEDLGLTDQDVGRVVTTLHLYQCQEVAETVDRNRSRRKDQKRQIGALRTSFEDATKGIEDLLTNPVLCSRVLEAYKKPQAIFYRDVVRDGCAYEEQFDAIANPGIDGHLLSCEAGNPEGEIYGKVLLKGRFYSEQFSAARAHPETAFEVLIEAHQRLSGLVAALNSLHAVDSPYATNRNRQKQKQITVRSLAKVLEPYTEGKRSLAADYIRDFLGLIGVNLKHKAILNLLSSNSTGESKLHFIS